MNDRRHRLLAIAVSSIVGGAVGVAGNGNNRHASPVHHGHGIWRLSRVSRLDTKRLA
jgi:hypothetical protein